MARLLRGGQGGFSATRVYTSYTYGYRMIHLRLRRAGRQINLKRVQRLYGEAQVMVKSRNLVIACLYSESKIN